MVGKRHMNDGDNSGMMSSGSLKQTTFPFELEGGETATLGSTPNVPDHLQ